MDLKGHGHWVNHFAVHTEFALRTGPHDETLQEFGQEYEKIQKKAEARYESLLGNNKKELLVSGSDDCTLILWCPEASPKPTKRMTGHGKPVNHVAYSPNGAFVISASFDNYIKLWNGQTGDFVANFRGHVGPVYQAVWSPDSRFLLSGSKDSTIKLWDIKTKKLRNDLPGHADEVYSVDWSPDGLKVASGSKDKMLRIWKK
jgi:ribosome assembly protein 4